MYEKTRQVGEALIAERGYAFAGVIRDEAHDPLTPRRKLEKMNAGGLEAELDPKIAAALASDPSERLYVYTRATGGWFIPAPPGAGLGVPFDFTHLAITRSAVYWNGWEQSEVTKKGFLGREKTERAWLHLAFTISVFDVERVTVSRDGYEPSFASWPAEQHLALDVSGKSRSQTFYNWAKNSADVVADVATIFAGLGIAVEDRAGVVPR